MVRALPTPLRRAGRVRIPAPREAEWPSVGVVVTTAGRRPNLLRRAIASISDQDYPGPVRIVVVFDDAAPDWELTRCGDRPILVLENWRRPGRAGARNAGILASGDCELVALCDEDDAWAPTKLTTQVEAVRARPGALFATCAHEIEFSGRRTARLSGVRIVDINAVTRPHVRSLRSSGFVARQRALATAPSRGGIGLLAEDCPSCVIDWDLLVRAARREPIVHVDAPLVRVLWRPATVDPAGCAIRAGALRWMADRHPELGARGAHLARILAEIACWEAVGENRRSAWQWGRAAIRARWHEPLGLVALAAAAGIVRGASVRGLLPRMTA